MAWPCINRVCCLTRVWNQLDKSDLSVPLTIQNYSDITEQEVHSVTKQLIASHAERAPGNHYSTPDGQGTRGSFRAKKEQHRHHHHHQQQQQQHPPGMPFPNVTQYKQDFKPWPIPRRENFPWISNGGSSVSHSPVNTHQSRAGKEERGRGRQQQVELEEEEEGKKESKTSSYRHEYRPWTGVKPAKSARKSPPAQYSQPGAEAAHVLCETSYQAAYSADVHRSSGVIPSTASNIQPAAVPLSITSGLHAATSPSSSSLQHNITPERTELSGATKGQEHLVRTKIPPNPSAVFQSGSRVFNV